MLIAWNDPDSPAPTFDDARIVRQHGQAKAEWLLPKLGSLVDDFFDSDAPLRVQGLVEMTNQATDDFRRKHPELSEDAVQVLATYFSFSNR